MRIGTLEAVVAMLRDVCPANENGTPLEPPVVRTSRRRANETYASAGNIILPLRFAERMPGWHRAHGAARLRARWELEDEH
jgi:hypothetical protein